MIKFLRFHMWSQRTSSLLFYSGCTPGEFFIHYHYTQGRWMLSSANSMTAFLTMFPFFTKENTNINIYWIWIQEIDPIDQSSHMGLLSETPVPFCFGFVFPKPQYSPYTIRRMSKIEPSFLPLSVLGPSPPVKFSPILHGLCVFHSGDSHDDLSTMFSPWNSSETKAALCSPIFLPPFCAQGYLVASGLAWGPHYHSADTLLILGVC